MKGIFLFCSRLRVYLTEIPVMIMLAITIFYNDQSTDLLKYYPLIVFLCLVIIFIAVYFFRLISITTDEVRYHGLFSSKDSAFITKDRTLKLSLHPRKSLRVELYGDAGKEPAFDWMKAEDVVHREICLFRGKAIGGRGSATKILKYFGVPSDILTSDAFEKGFTFEDETISVNAVSENDIPTVSISFKKTII